MTARDFRHRRRAGPSHLEYRTTAAHPRTTPGTTRARPPHTPARRQDRLQMSRMTARRRIVRLDGASRRGGEEHMAAEEPLEMRIGGRPFTVTMRTPGDDFDLVAGHLVSEGVLTGSHDVVQMKFCSADNGCTSTAYLDSDPESDL